MRYRDQTTWIVILVPNGHTGHGSMTQMARPIWHFFIKKWIMWVGSNGLWTDPYPPLEHSELFIQDLLEDVDYAWWNKIFYWMWIMYGEKYHDIPKKPKTVLS